MGIGKIPHYSHIGPAKPKYAGVVLAFPITYEHFRYIVILVSLYWRVAGVLQSAPFFEMQVAGHLSGIW